MPADRARAVMGHALRAALDIARVRAVAPNSCHSPLLHVPPAFVAHVEETVLKDAGLPRGTATRSRADRTM